MNINGLNGKVGLYNQQPNIKKEEIKKNSDPDKTSSLHENNEVEQVVANQSNESTIVKVSNEAYNQLKQIQKDNTNNNEAPINKAKIEELKMQIKNGTYKPNASKIADSLLNETINLLKRN